MKALKIGLVILIVGVIGYFVRESLISTPPPPPISLPENQFTRRIEQEIDSLRKLPDNKFCRIFYEEVEYHINDYGSDHRFSESSTENNQWKEHLTRNLYSAYADKFISQAFYLFNNPEWDNDKLEFIRKEYQTLRRSEWLEKGSPVDQKFTDIHKIYSKYDEIMAFISACRKFSYSNYYLSANFPVSDVENKIKRAKEYLRKELENESVNNCARLHNELKNVPQHLFNVHVRYLNDKIDKWSERYMYPNYSSQSDYFNNLYQPLKKEIEALDNDLYKVPETTFSREYKKLTDKWSADNKKAYDYEYPKAE